MKKIAIVVQRYGLEVNGGAEYHCRILAEKLNPLFDLEVITSCAKDYTTWRNEYQPGVSSVNGVKVRRFEVVQERNKKKTQSIERRLRKKTFFHKSLQLFGILSFVETLFNLNDNLKELGNEWAKQQGPYTPSLIDFLQHNKQYYDAVIFFTYLYYPTFYGLQTASERSILIPTAHDEPPIYFPNFKSFFKLPKAILYNTKAEQHFVNQLFHNEGIYSDVVGVGIDEPIYYVRPDLIPVTDPYIIYIGRIDPAKGCDILFEYFIEYKKTDTSNLKLVLVGQPFMEIPTHNDILPQGFVSEELKGGLLQYAKALIIPSFYESLSLVTLESMMAGIPVIANDFSEVLRDHIEQSGGGYLFSDGQTFKKALDRLTSPATDFALLKSNAKKYVVENYNWDVVIDKVSKAVDYVSSETNR
ncbi:glycosyltransferase family 4 protein [Pedobacter frigidisoli]|uniref:glycosyltransferase family 4 protein n=1 Tax=Pedobacter frigidisoli TaxID=2530455 RepID=UPI00292CCE44|nr:glycosyltransferase family 4 protein [Pedobacter frigidisoli]